MQNFVLIKDVGFWHNVDKMLVACTIIQNLFILTKRMLKKLMFVALNMNYVGEC
jgi:hypothetical protein